MVVDDVGSAVALERGSASGQWRLIGGDTA